MENYKAPPNKIIYADPSHCLGCHSCEMACAVAHSDANNVVEAASMEGLISRTHVVAVDGDCIPMQCRQCEDAPCAKICPTGAMRQSNDHGSVFVETGSCIGCKLCTMVCPFGAVAVPSSMKADGRIYGGIAVKCDLCTGWCAPTEGDERTACEAACPTMAIRLIDLDEYRRALLRARAAEVASTHRKIGGLVSAGRSQGGAR